jgi:MtN3 and saliva related transmembrane protein
MDKEIIGIAAGILTATSLIPQAIKSIKEKTASDVSIFIFIILLGGNGLWTWYGLLLKDMPIIFTNAFAVCMDILMLVLKIKYGNKNNSKKGSD